MGAALDRDTIEKAYDRWAPVYDFVFGRVFEQGRQASIAAAEAHVGPAADASSRSASAPASRC